MLLAVSKASGRECGGIPHIAAGLQGGLMAGEVCGAVCGAVLAIGLFYGEQPDGKAIQLTEEYMRQFAERNEAVRCIDIIGFNIGSADSQLEVKNRMKMLRFLIGGGRKKCNKVVRNAVEVLLETIQENEG